jgi:hypothetical protein
MMAYFTAMVDGTITLAGGSPATVPAVQQSTSLSDTNTVPAPGINGVLASVTVPATGTYEVEVVSFIGGTTVAALEATNMRLRVNAVAVGRVVNPVPSTTGAVGIGSKRARIQATSGQVIDVVAVAAATAASSYTCDLVATRKA